MKRRILILTLALAAVTAAIGTTVASLRTPPIAHYVYSSATPGGPLTNVGTFTITNTGSATVFVRVFDISQNATVTRIAYDADGIALKNSSEITFTSSVQVP